MLQASPTSVQRSTTRNTDARLCACTAPTRHEQCYLHATTSTPWQNPAMSISQSWPSSSRARKTRITIRPIAQTQTPPEAKLMSMPNHPHDVFSHSNTGVAHSLTPQVAVCASIPASAQHYSSMLAVPCEPCMVYPWYTHGKSMSTGPQLQANPQAMCVAALSPRLKVPQTQQQDSLQETC